MQGAVDVVHRARGELLGLPVVEATDLRAVQVLELLLAELRLQVVPDDAGVADVARLPHLPGGHEGLDAIREPPIQPLGHHQHAGI